VREQFLVEITGDEAIPARRKVQSLEELNRLLEAWVRTVYHGRVHSETGEAPRTRWDAAGPQFIPPAGRLRYAFAWSDIRQVRKTATVELEGNVYSVDPFLTGRKVECVFDPADMSEIDVYWQGRKAGKGIPQVIGRHSHPKAPPEDGDPPPLKLTGTDYLGDIVGRDDSGSADRLRLSALDDSQDHDEDGEGKQ
jgi:putative transposase